MPDSLFYHGYNQKSLASKILSLSAHQLTDHWEKDIISDPFYWNLLCKKNRFAATCYKSANWTNIGLTKGRGKLGG